MFRAESLIWHRFLFRQITKLTGQREAPLVILPHFPPRQIDLPGNLQGTSRRPALEPLRLTLTLINVDVPRKESAAGPTEHQLLPSNEPKIEADSIHLRLKGSLSSLQLNKTGATCAFFFVLLKFYF